jgi:hypothetical protein
MSVADLEVLTKLSKVVCWLSPRRDNVDQNFHPCDTISYASLGISSFTYGTLLMSRSYSVGLVVPFGSV